MAYLANRICSATSDGQPRAWSRAEIEALGRFGVLPPDYQYGDMDRTCRDAAWSIHTSTPEAQATLRNLPSWQVGAQELVAERAAASKFEADVAHIEQWLVRANQRLGDLQALVTDLQTRLERAGDERTGERAELQQRLLYAQMQFAELATQYRQVLSDRNARNTRMTRLRQTFNSMNNGSNAGGNAGGNAGVNAGDQLMLGNADANAVRSRYRDPKPENLTHRTAADYVQRQRDDGSVQVRRRDGTRSWMLPARAAQFNLIDDLDDSWLSRVPRQ